MNCLSRAPQAVIPRNNREEQVNRRVIRTFNQTFRVYIFLFYFIYYFFFHFLNDLFMGKYMELCILCFLGVENIM